MGGTAVVASASDEEAHYTKEKIRYQDCLLGKVGVPTEKKQKYLFQIVSILCSVPLTFTINWALRNGANISWASFSQSLYLIPLTLGIVIGARFLIGNPLVDRIIRALFAPRLQGLKKSICMSGSSIIFMSPIIASLKSLLLSGDLSGVSSVEYLASLPETFLVSFTLSYFFISPLLKKLFIEKVDPLMHDSSLAHLGTDMRRSAFKRLNMRAQISAGTIALEGTAAETSNQGVLQKRLNRRFEAIQFFSPAENGGFSSARAMVGVY